ncbi:MAG: hypothetical protein JWQ14_2183 [Adhaeribacter sp.]|nr:hypothetical protein [Adhaeribacter sp.]
MTVIRASLLFYNSRTLELNPDEYPNYHLAENWLQGKGYTRFDPATQKNKSFAFYATFPIWVYALFLHFKISISYWVLLVQLAALFLYSLSIFYFYKTLSLFISSASIRLWGMVVYAVYPSTLFYIGSLFWYENITMPILVIVFYYLLLLLQNQKIPPFIAVLIPIGVALSILFRGQLLIIYFIIFSVFIFLLFGPSRENRRYVKTGHTVSLTLLILVIFSHVPIVIKNYKMFGGIMLSTQPGFELWQGHNPFANEKWTMDWTDPGEPLYDYTIARLPNLHQLDQYTESRERAKLARDWLKQNPTEELFLIGRKLKLYFTPDNSPFYPGTSLPGYNWPNPLNIAVHGLFFTALIFAMVKNKYFGFSPIETFCFTPIVATILLCLVFFFGHRWRFYAEPYLIFFGFLFLQKLKDYRHTRRKTKALVPNYSADI